MAIAPECLENRPDERQDVPLAERLASLTFEQLQVAELLSKGVKRSEIAAMRSASTPEITAIASSLSETLGTQTRHGAIYLLLEAGVLPVDEAERSLAGQKIAGLDDRGRGIIGAMMPDRDWDDAALRLGLAPGTLKSYYSAVNKQLGSRTRPETIRWAYAGGLKAEEAEQPAVDMAVSRGNLLAFLSWMYPNQQLNGFHEMNEEELRVAARVIAGDSKDRMKGLDARTAKKILPSVQNVEAWLEGQSIARIAKGRGKTDGSIMLGLTGLAAKIATPGGPEDLYERVKQAAEKKATRAWEIGAMATANSEDALALGEVSVRDVVMNIKNALPDRKVTSSDEPYERTADLPETLEAELISWMNARHQPIHISEIAELYSDNALTNEDFYRQLDDSLSGLADGQLIFDVGDGYYSTWLEPEEVEEASPELPEPAIEVPPAATPEPPRPRERSYREEDYSYRPPVVDKRSALKAMLEQAGIHDTERPYRRRSSSGRRTKR